MPFDGTHHRRLDARSRVRLPADWSHHIRAHPADGLTGVYRSGHRFRLPESWIEAVDQRRSRRDAEPTQDRYDTADRAYRQWLHDVEWIPLDSRDRLVLQLAPGTPVELQGHNDWFVIRPLPSRGNANGRYDVGYQKPPVGFMRQDQSQLYRAIALVQGIHFGMFGHMADPQDVMEVLQDFEASYGPRYEPSLLAPYVAEWLEEGGPGMDAAPPPLPRTSRRGGPAGMPPNPGPFRDPFSDVYSTEIVDDLGGNGEVDVFFDDAHGPTPVSGAALDEIRAARRGRGRGRGRLVGGPETDALRDARRGRRPPVSRLQEELDRYRH